MLSDTIRTTIETFCIDFIKNPYLCYTEHGIHAYFYYLLYRTLKESGLFIEVDGKKMCIIQKEYCMAYSCGKPKRQHWDIAIIKSPPEIINKMFPKYDYLALDSVVEFGLNEDEEHMDDDINRLNHPKSYVKNKFVVHLNRISKGGKKRFSKRDFSENSNKILSKDKIVEKTKNNDIEIYFAQFHETKPQKIEAWKIYHNNSISLLNKD